MKDEESVTESPTENGISLLTASGNSELNSSSSDIEKARSSQNQKGIYPVSPSSPNSEPNDTYGVDSNTLTENSEAIDKISEPLESLDTLPGPPSAKDGGYGWVVVFTVFMVNALTAGYVKSFGITYTLIMDYFPGTQKAAAGWTLGLLVGCRALLSPAMGALTVLLGPRKCVMIGTLISVTGLLLAVPAFSIAYIAFTLGGLVGIGMCVTETPGFLVVTDYFDKKRALANGLRAAGNPTGAVIFAPMIVLFQQYFGLQGAFIMIAGVMLHLLVFGMLMRPFEQHKQMIENRYWRKNLHSNPALNSQILNLKNQQESQEKKKKPLDFTYLKNPAYIPYLLLVMFTNIAMPSALLFAPIYGRSIGLSDMQNSLITSYTSCCDAVLRVLFGWIFNQNVIKKRHGFIAGLVIGGTGCLIVPLCFKMWHLFIFATMLSMFMASFWALINVLLADQFGGDSMASTWGFFRMFQGICHFISPAIVGYVIDVTGGMTVPYLMMGSSLILGAIFFSLQPLIAKHLGNNVTPN